MSTLPTSSRRSRDISHEDLVCLDDFPKKSLKEVVQMLIDSGRIDESGNRPLRSAYLRMT